MEVERMKAYFNNVQTLDELRKQYKDLLKKYHPDNYAGSPIADLATEKMKEVNEAYDQILNDRKQGSSDFIRKKQRTQFPFPS